MKRFKRRAMILALLGLLIVAGAGWGYYHFFVISKYDRVIHATRL